MKFKFKIQQYQTDAVDAVVGVFAGQPNRTAKYTRDLGRRKGGEQELFSSGERNADVELRDDELLANIRKAQTRHGIPQSRSLTTVNGLGACALDAVHLLPFRAARGVGQSERVPDMHASSCQFIHGETPGGRAWSAHLRGP